MSGFERPGNKPVIVSATADCIAFVRQRLGEHWVVGAPLGLGKPNHLLNALYQAACDDPRIRLEIFTALSLNPPKAASGLKQRFLGPFVQRHFGDYPRLQYLHDLDHRKVPANITISEFYFRSGSRLGDPHAQRHYLSSNYTHVARDMAARGVNLLVQMVGTHPQRPGLFSLSSNPDVTLELMRRLARDQFLLVAQSNPAMPYMDGDAELSATHFDLVLEQHPQPLFAVPRMPVNDADHLIGLHCSRLIRDGGTLQLGIGSLGDAVSYFTVLRQQNNAAYHKLLIEAETAERADPGLLQRWGGEAPFERGLYAASEMFMEGFLHLYQAGVLRRKVYDQPVLQDLLNRGLLTEALPADTLEILWNEGALPRQLDQESLDWMHRFGILRAAVSCDQNTLFIAAHGPIDNDLSRPESRNALAQHAGGRSLRGGVVMHAAFFLGSQWMYDTLNAMSDTERACFQMTGVERINQLYRGEALDRSQRLEGRFINTTMKMTLLGAAASDQLENGQVVSGVGGQYNFVAMAHALDRTRSILMLRSHRGPAGKPVSNIVWEFPHATIPRHLRDVVITEYGIVDLRSASDEEVIQKLLCIADSRWQESLRARAISAGKLNPTWRIPSRYQNNTPAWVKRAVAVGRQQGLINTYPFGSDFTAVEQEIARALQYVQSAGQGLGKRLRLILSSATPAANATAQQAEHLRRMGLEHPASIKELLEKRLLTLALKSTSAQRPENTSGR